MLPLSAPSPPQLASPWRVIAFDRTGRAWTGAILHPAQEWTLLAIRQVEARIQSGDNFMIELLEGCLPEDEYSHAVAVPA